MSDQNKSKRFNIWKHLAQHKTKGIFGVIGLLAIVGTSVGVYLYSKTKKQTPKIENQPKEPENQLEEKEPENQLEEKEPENQPMESENQSDQLVPPNSPLECSKKCFKSSEKCICEKGEKSDQEE